MPGIKWHKRRSGGGLGFKEIQKFNNALLAKQVWRIFSSPNLLVSKVLKAKYFHKESIFQCKVPRNASWIWQSFMSSRKPVEEGSWKKVGNGKSIRIWEDRWIPSSSDGKVTTVRPDCAGPVMVDELIDGFRWNANLIFRTFCNQDAMKILQIPISLTGRDDSNSNYWKLSGNGQYTVKSGYKELCKQVLPQNDENTRTGEHSLTRSSHKVWKKTWKLKIKEKIKHFIWKCSTGTLPVRALIFGRTGKGHPCKGCGDHIESVEHALLTCGRAQEVWKMAPIHWEGIPNRTFKHGWWNIMEASNRIGGLEHIALTANILWQLWKARNNWEFNAKLRHPMKVVQIAHSEWLESVEAEITTQAGSRHETREESGIREQNVGKAGGKQVQLTIHQNVDQHILGIGVVTSDITSQALEIWALKERASGDSLLDYALALRLTLAKARQKQWTRITIHVQSQQMLKWLSTGKSKDMRMATLLDDVQNLKSLFQNCSFSLSLDSSNLSNDISLYAVGISNDEEWDIP